MTVLYLVSPSIFVHSVKPKPLTKIQLKCDLNCNFLHCKGLKQQVESLQIKTDDLTQKLHFTEEKVCYG
jgi:hypothetical protein